MSLKEIRESRALTRTQLAELSGVHKTKIAQYESGTLKVENMTLRNDLKLSQALKCHPKDLLDS